MCAIAGIWGEANEALIRRMTELQRHRGPDDSGVKVAADRGHPVSLGHRRLTIIDLSSAGRQPMANEDGSVWVVYNGEIYNFLELRSQLEAKGHVFKSKTDTEVLVHAYEQWGLDFIGKLNGIFAFALWDARRGELHLARDPHGVKPLYYVRRGGRVLFASEIKALFCDPSVPREVNPEALAAYTQFRYAPEPLTLFKDVHKVPPGHGMTFTAGGHTTWSHYTLAYDVTAQAGPAELAQELRGIFSRAVRRQMISDVPVGLFLSGGVDSSGLLALAQSFHSQPLKTFTIGFREEDKRHEGQPDDIRYARMVASLFGADHQEIVLEPKIVELLPKIIWHLDDPIADPAAITSYLICQAAGQQGTKVLLSGQGGDEVFCGYAWHLANHLARYYQALPKVGQGLVGSLVRLLPAAKGGRLTGTLRRLRKFMSSASLEFEPRLLGYLSYATRENLRGLFRPEFQELIEGGAGERAHRELLAQSKGWHPINRMLHLDMATFLPSLNLAYTDKTSMASGVEVRVPYLDREIVDFMAKAPPELKMKGTARKYLMKRALKGLLPREILHRKKAGFGAPIRTWMVRDLREMIEDLLSESSVKRRGFFNPQYVRSLIQENRRGHHDYNYLLYILLNFELWCRVYLDPGEGRWS